MMTPTPSSPHHKQQGADAVRIARLSPVVPLAHAEPVQTHLENIVTNLPLIADMGYASVTLAVLDGGTLLAVAATRTTTAAGPQVADRVGKMISLTDEPEAYQALAAGESVHGSRQRDRDGVAYVTVATPVRPEGDGDPIAVIIRDAALAPHETPGRMEEEFSRIADDLVALLARHPLVDLDGNPFSTTRRPGDGVMRVDLHGEVLYPSPNAVAIMRRAGYEERVRTSRAAEFPGGGFGVVPVLGTERAIEREAAVAGRTLLYRTIGLPTGAFVLVEDVTDARAQEAKLRVREATIREVHHRVKNNLQTVAALLRMQARRVEHDEARAALVEATGRVESMAAVHTLLAYSDFERVDLYDVIEAAVTSIKRGVAGESDGVQVEVVGERGIVLDAPTVSSLAMVVTELVHNALEHGLAVGSTAEVDGTVTVQFEREQSTDADEPTQMLRISVSDTGAGLPADFELDNASGLGLSIVQTIVTQDLGGTVRVERGLAADLLGARFEVEVPLH